MKFPCIDPESRQPGYMRTKIPGTRVNVLLHRLVYQRAYGSMPEVVRHLCNNPRCINPLHLTDGTHKQNTADMVSAGRHRKDHRTLNSEQVIQIRNAIGSQTAIASLFGVSRAVVRKIREGKTYREI